MGDAEKGARHGPVVRVGDAERRAVDDRLQRAHGEGRLTLDEYEARAADVWAARTQADLDALTADLPATAASALEPARAGREAGAVPWRRYAGGLLGVLVVGAAVLWGGPQLAADDGVTVFSSRTIGVAPGDDRVEMGVLFGSADIVVPDDARVVVGGTTVFASVDCEAACAATGPDTVTVDVSGAFGSVDIVTRSEAAAEDADSDDD